MLSHTYDFLHSVPLSVKWGYSSFARLWGGKCNNSVVETGGLVWLEYRVSQPARTVAPWIQPVLLDAYLFYPNLTIIPGKLLRWLQDKTKTFLFFIFLSINRSWLSTALLARSSALICTAAGSWCPLSDHKADMASRFPHRLSPTCEAEVLLNNHFKIYKQGNGGTEKSSHLLEVTQTQNLIPGHWYSQE